MSPFTACDLMLINYREIFKMYFFIKKFTVSLNQQSKDNKEWNDDVKNEVYWRT